MEHFFDYLKQILDAADQSDNLAVAELIEFIRKEVPDSLNVKAW